jgi:uncharacterized membrane protein
MADFEPASLRLYTPAEFRAVVFRYVLISFGLLMLFLAAGVVGYRVLAGFSWIDSFLNASMILGGMGPVNPVLNVPGKVFSGIYALFSGAAYPALTALVLYPIVHHMMRRMHVETIAAWTDKTNDLP